MHYYTAYTVIYIIVLAKTNYNKAMLIILSKAKLKLLFFNLALFWPRFLAYTLVYIPII